MAQGDSLNDLMRTWYEGNLTSQAVISSLAEDVAVPAASTSPILVALQGYTAQKPAMSASGDKVNAQATIDGRQVIQNAAIPDLTWQYAGIAGGIVSSTADVVLKTALATYRNYISAIQISHDTLVASTEFVIKDGSTVIFRGKLQTTAQEGAMIQLPTALRSSVNTALNFALLTSNVGGVFVNAQGYTGV